MNLQPNDRRAGCRTLNGDAPPADVPPPVISSSAGSGHARILLTDIEAAAALGVSQRKFHELRAEPWMCRPIVLGPRLLRWVRSELEAAVQHMPRQAAPGNEPAQLLRGRIERQMRSGVPA